jgi:hypothetical protein
MRRWREKKQGVDASRDASRDGSPAPPRPQGRGEGASLEGALPRLARKENPPLKVNDAPSTGSRNPAAAAPQTGRSTARRIRPARTPGRTGTPARRTRW